MEVRNKGSTASSLEPEMVEDTEDWLEEEEGEDYDSNYWMIILILRNRKRKNFPSRGIYVRS